FNQDNIFFIFDNFKILYTWFSKINTPSFHSISVQKIQFFPDAARLRRVLKIFIYSMVLVTDEHHPYLLNNILTSSHFPRKFCKSCQQSDRLPFAQFPLN
ncbi:hypothetical protein I010_10378, partial [Pasteurella multocida 1500C]